MKKFAVEEMRNVGFIGGGRSGKTSLAEAVIFSQKAIPKLGSVDAGETVCDFDADEIEKRNSHHAALANVDHERIDRRGVGDKGVVQQHALAVIGARTPRRYAAGDDQPRAKSLACVPGGDIVVTVKGLQPTIAMPPAFADKDWLSRTALPSKLAPLIIANAPPPS